MCIENLIRLMVSIFAERNLMIPRENSSLDSCSPVGWICRRDRDLINSSLDEFFCNRM